MMDERSLSEPVAEPLIDIDGIEHGPQPPDPGIALCLSGGGFRAMLFQVGALWRLNELKVLTKLRQISSSSGGSITAAALAANWDQLQRDPAEPDCFDEASFKFALVKPLRQLAEHTLDESAFGWGVRFSSMQWLSEEITACYRYHLFGTKTLQNLPDEPRFVFTATNIKTGSLWRFSKPFMADYHLGIIRKPRVPLALVVAASAAFSPCLSASVLNLDPSPFDPAVASAYDDPRFRMDAMLTDGGVTDHLAIETAWKQYATILVSDGGRGAAPEPRPATDWAGHTYRMMALLFRQVSDSRRRQVVEAFKANVRGGALWGIQMTIDSYGLKDALDCSSRRTAELANTPTRLARLSESVQERLINWGYASCDAAMRRYYLVSAGPPPAFPFPGSGV